MAAKKKIPTEYQLNGNSTKYNWNEEFAHKVADKMFNWFNNGKKLRFYSSFPRDDLKITYNQFIRKISEYPQVWDDVQKELDLITTTRLANGMLDGKLPAAPTVQALKHMGLKWNDKMEINHNVKSLGETIQDVWNELENPDKEKKVKIPPSLDDLKKEDS